MKLFNFWSGDWVMNIRKLQALTAMEDTDEEEVGSEGFCYHSGLVANNEGNEVKIGASRALCLDYGRVNWGCICYQLCYYWIWVQLQEQSIMNGDLQMNMSMTIQWTEQCAFLFQAFKTQKVITFLVGCIFSSIVSFMAVSLPSWKQKLIPNLSDHYSMIQVQGQDQVAQPPTEQQTKNRLKLLGFYVLYSAIHIANMLLIMTMNGWVILWMLVGGAIGYYFFCSESKCCNN